MSLKDYGKRTASIIRDAKRIKRWIEDNELSSYVEIHIHSHYARSKSYVVVPKFNTKSWVSISSHRRIMHDVALFSDLEWYERNINARDDDEGIKNMFIRSIKSHLKNDNCDNSSKLKLRALLVLIEGVK